MNSQILKQLSIFIILGAFLFLFPIIGALVASIGFCDPDTCWHLALGKWIFTHRGLPYIDPFSSNVFHSVFVSSHLPLIQQEWLSDLSFYSVLAMFGQTGLLIFTALLAICSFVIIPSALMRRSGVPRIIALVLITLGLYTSSFRLWVRPEAFSFLFMAALVSINEIYQSAISRKQVIAGCAIIFSIMSLWTNFHGLFIVGLAYLVGYLAIVILELCWLKKTAVNIKPAFMAVVAAGLGTLNTPWHFKFWQYIYTLAISPMASGNAENGTITLKDLLSPTFIPLCLFLALTWGLLLWPIWKKGAKEKSAKSLLLPLGLSICGTIVIILCRRMTPLAVLVILGALSKAFSMNDFNACANNKLLKIGEKYLAQKHIPDGWINTLLGAAACSLACYVTANYVMPVSIPTASRLFHPPYKAIQYLENQLPKGRLLNDAKFGSMMTWNMNNCPDIFIDGRFYVDHQLFYDYKTMRLAKGNWTGLLDKYNIDWLFFPLGTPLTSQLEGNPSWEILYKDKEAIILSRKEALN